MMLTSMNIEDVPKDRLAEHNELLQATHTFKEMLDMDKMRALCLGEGEILDFGKVGELRRITY